MKRKKKPAFLSGMQGQDRNTQLQKRAGQARGTCECWVVLEVLLDPNDSWGTWLAAGEAMQQGTLACKVPLAWIRAV